MSTIDTIGATVQHISSGLIGTVEDVHDFHGIQVRWNDGFVNAGHSADTIRPATAGVFLRRLVLPTMSCTACQMPERTVADLDLAFDLADAHDLAMGHRSEV